MKRYLSWLILIMLIVAGCVQAKTTKPGFVVAPFSRATTLAVNSVANVLIVAQNQTGVTQTVTNLVPQISGNSGITSRFLANTCGVLAVNQSCYAVVQLKSTDKPSNGNLNISVCAFNGAFCSKIAKPIDFSVEQPVAILVSPTTPSIANGTTVQFTAMGFFPNGTIQDITDSASWQSSKTAVATVSNATDAEGLATGTGAGSTTISASLHGVSGSTTLTVTAATLTSIDVEPANPSLANGYTEQFIATGIYSDGTSQDITSLVTWSSSNQNVATISNNSSNKGEATANSVGTATITATLGAISGATNLQVTAAVLTAISVTPTNPSVTVYTTQQFTATGIYSDNTSKEITNDVNWSTGSAQVAIASNLVSSKGVVAGVGVGTTTVSAQLGSISGSTNVTITSAVLQSIDISPTNATLPAGNELEYTATGIYNNNRTQDITTTVTWRSSNTNIATISNADGAEGLAKGLQSGTVSISASQDGVTASTNLTVTAPVLVSIAVTPAGSSIPTGTSLQYAATGTFSDASTLDLTDEVTWTSSAKAIATISNAPGSNGLASGQSAGAATITASFNGISGSTSLTVTAATLVSIAVTPATTSVVQGATVQLTATGTYSDASTKNITEDAFWTSSNANAVVSNVAGSKGLVTGVNVGSATISALDSSVGGAAVVTVTSMNIGGDYEGGKIACLDGGLNNLIAAVADNSSGLQWGGGATGTVTNAQSQIDGAANTTRIVNVLGASTTYAAGLCSAYEIDSAGNSPCQVGNTCYSDWFLPSTNQLACVLRNKNAIGGFTQVFYWSSTEYAPLPNFSAWFGSTFDGSINAGNKIDPHAVRCVRQIT